MLHTRESEQNEGWLHLIKLKVIIFWHAKQPEVCRYVGLGLGSSLLALFFALMKLPGMDTSLSYTLGLRYNRKQNPHINMGKTTKKKNITCAQVSVVSLDSGAQSFRN